MPVQYPPLTKLAGKPKNDREKLLAALKLSGIIPSPFGMAANGEEDLEEMLAMMKDLEGAGEEKVATKAPQTGMGNLLQKMESQLQKSGSKGSKLLNKVNPPAGGGGYSAMEMLSQAAPKAAKAAKNPVAELASKASTPIRKPAAEEAAERLAVRTGSQTANPDAQSHEFDALRQLYDTAYKLKATAAQKDIEKLWAEMAQGGGPRQPTPQATLNYVGHKRQMIADQLNKLAQLLGSQGTK